MIVGDRDTFHTYLPLPPNLANPGRSIGGNWKARHFVGKTYKEGAVKYMQAVHNPLPAYRAARYLAHFLVPGRRDVDGLVASLKWPQDAFVLAGLIPNDAPRYLQLARVPEQTVCRPKRRDKEPEQHYYLRRHNAEARHGVYLFVWPVEDPSAGASEWDHEWETYANTELARLVAEQKAHAAK